MKPRCLITGCDLVATNTGETAHGDLHQIGDSYIFNAVRNEGGESDWQHKKPPTNLLLYLNTNAAFERRGVIVFSTAAVILSDHAAAYVERAP